MSSVKSLLFSHNHHLLSVKGCEAGLDVLAFEGDEALSQPFRYRIEFTSADHAISKEMMLMKAASLTLQAPVAQGFGINVQQPVRVIQGVVTGFERLSTSRDETHYALTLQPRLALLNRSHQNAIYQDQSVPQIVEKILRERHGLRGQDFLFSLTKTYPRREQVMQYGEDDLRFITRLLGEVGIWFRFTADTRLHIDVAEFCDSQQGYEKGLTLPSVPPSGQQSAGVDAVWEMACRHRVVDGFSQVYTNYGEIENKGFEFSLAYNKRLNKDWSINATLTGSTLKNKIKKMGEPAYNTNSDSSGKGTEDGSNTGAVGAAAGYHWGNHSICKEGYAVGSFYGFRVEGVFQSDAEVEAMNKAATLAAGKDWEKEKVYYQTDGTKAGDFKYKDLNGDGIINEDDMDILGDGFPTLNYGLNLGASYKNWDFSVYLYGVLGHTTFCAFSLNGVVSISSINVIPLDTHSSIRADSFSTVILSTLLPILVNTSEKIALSSSGSSSHKP